ncbi:unnamed protein product [Candida verbasci]|uniref:Chromatin-remodeling complexes subunit NGG1 n=1 Tax=Candida verbasci TaxID=1227364 RepID=A0A9W4TWC8_9ASCO|nr:unnamed protein product [Candida verbasci]
MTEHLASTTLDDIINELKLSYDSSNGLLEGDHIHKIPNLNTLTNLNKLFKNLYKQLNEIEKIDDDLLNSISKKHKLEEEELVDKPPPIKKIKTEETESKEQVNSKDDPIPPEQLGSFTHENDTRLKNPKSEYVEPQALSKEAIAELGLYSEENNNLETQGKDYLKKKYGVASYPEHDLLDLLPGTIPNIDFSKNKPPTNQVQFTTFQSYIESYFRPFSNEDLKFLNERNVIPPGFEKQSYDPDLNPFIIPKLGKFYADVWAEEDSTLLSKLNSPAFQQPQFDSYKAKGKLDEINDSNLYSEDISCGPLSSRLLSALFSTHEVEEEEMKDEVAAQINSEEYKLNTEVNDFQSLEERLKRELKYIGIFMNLPSTDKKRPKKSSSIIDNEEWIKNKEDDEVCAEIRTLQKELKEVVSRNRANKQKLIPLVEDQLAYQEYCAILEDLDKQVDQAYMKRLKGKGKKKKTIENTLPTQNQQAINSGMRALLEKRKRWIENVGNLFPPPEQMKRVPHDSKLITEGTVEEEETPNSNNLF